MRLTDRRVLVVGASSGVGLASATAIAAEGGRVAFAARRHDRIEQAAADAGSGAIAIACDARDEAACQAAVDRTVEAFGGLDAVVYSPGIGIFRPIETIGAADWRHVLDLNLIAVNVLLSAAIPHLTAVRGKAVLISSIAIDDAPPRHSFAPYVVSKVALETLARCWQNEHRAIGVTTVAMADTISEFGFDQDVEALLPIVQRWDDEGYGYGRRMEASAVAEQVVNALASVETVRRIAITPAYDEAGSMEEELHNRAGK